MPTTIDKFENLSHNCKVRRTKLIQKNITFVLLILIIPVIVVGIGGFSLWQQISLIREQQKILQDNRQKIIAIQTNRGQHTLPKRCNGDQYVNSQYNFSLNCPLDWFVFEGEKFILFANEPADNISDASINHRHFQLFIFDKQDNKDEAIFNKSKKESEIGFIEKQQIKNKDGKMMNFYIYLEPIDPDNSYLSVDKTGNRVPFASAFAENEKYGYVFNSNRGQLSAKDEREQIELLKNVLLTFSSELSQ